jgi:DNA repair exonuclease SbcCD ATPase subunit
MPTIDEVYIEGSYNGGKVAPGMYQVVLKIDGVESSTSLLIQSDPRINVAAQDFAQQDVLLKSLEKDVTDIHVAVTRMRGVTKQIKELSELVENDPAKAPVVSSAKLLLQKIKVWEESLIQPKSQAYDDVINFVNKLSANIIFVHGELNSTVPYVTKGQQARYEELHQQWLKYKNEMDQLLAGDIAAFNQLCNSMGVTHIMLPE